MGRIDDGRLLELALGALEQVAVEARRGPVRRTWALRLALAFLASRQPGDPVRWPFDQFWRALAVERERNRWPLVNASLNAIYVALGRRRDVKTASAFERA